jgi:hypothetical protein
VPDINNISKDNIENLKFSDSQTPAVKIPADKIAIGEIREGIQYAAIDVNDNEFSPAIVVLQDNIKTVWTINGVKLNDHNNQMFFPEYNAILKLQEGENDLKVVPEFDFTFSCLTGELNGYVKVVADINKINIENIKEEVRNYRPANTYGGASCH